MKCGRCGTTLYSISEMCRTCLKNDGKCLRCEGLGKIAHGDGCNCGSGEGCERHSRDARRAFGMKCPDCKGTGRERKK